MEKENAEIRKENAELRTRVSDLEEKVEQTHSGKNGGAGEQKGCECIIYKVIKTAHPLVRIRPTYLRRFKRLAVSRMTTINRRETYTVFIFIWRGSNL